MCHISYLKSSKTKVTMVLRSVLIPWILLIYPYGLVGARNDDRRLSPAMESLLLLKKQSSDPVHTHKGDNSLRLVHANRGGGESSSLLERYPFASAVAISTCKNVAADLLTQIYIEAKPWEPKRTAVFATFGCLFQGCAQYLIVNLGWERLFPGTNAWAVAAKIAGNNFISDPLLFFPVFYIFQESIQQGSLDIKTVRLALSRYLANAILDLRNAWLIWIPGHIVTYGVMPPHKRIPWMSSLSFFYMIVLSATRGGSAGADS
jgi:hypothetical protein